MIDNNTHHTFYDFILLNLRSLVYLSFQPGLTAADRDHE